METELSLDLLMDCRSGMWSSIQSRRPVNKTDSQQNEPEKSQHSTQNVSTAVKTWDLWNLLAKGVKTEILPPCVKERTLRPFTAAEHSNEYSSATGPVRIAELHPKGLFVRLHNSSRDEQDLGDFHLQQNIEGHPTSVFFFPHRTLIPPRASLMVWTEASQRPHLPPAHLLWTGMDHLGTEPWITTILCQPDGQVATAWYTPAPYTADTRQTPKSACHHESFQTKCQSSLLPKELRQFTFYTPPGGVSYSDRKDKEPFLLVKRKVQTSRRCRSPWAQNPGCITHPAHTQPGKVDFRGLPSRNNWTFQCQPHPAPKVTIADQHGKATSSKRRLTRSTGPCLGGLMFVGPVPPLTSPLQRYCDAYCPTSKTCFSKLPNT
ncbi:lamin tail domain-containing protein 1 [Arapaima gigas]